MEKLLQLTYLEIYCAFSSFQERKQAVLIYSNQDEPAKKVIPHSLFSISILTENKNLYVRGFVSAISNNIENSYVSWRYHRMGYVLDDFVKYQENVEDAYKTVYGDSTHIIKKTDGHLYQSIGNNIALRLLLSPWICKI